MAESIAQLKTQVAALTQARLDDQSRTKAKLDALAASIAALTAAAGTAVPDDVVAEVQTNIDALTSDNAAPLPPAPAPAPGATPPAGEKAVP